MALGGGIGMIPFLEEIARNQADIDGEEFLQLMGIAQTFPGAMGINTAVIIGYRMGVVKGAIASLIGVTLP
ncbi:MAG: chromate transporter, partial [Syntrophomonadaceae bacterium]|nr:chromate transporter [Syntrophomonadaceae bacterium]